MLNIHSIEDDIGDSYYEAHNSLWSYSSAKLVLLEGAYSLYLLGEQP